jgi:hypothetical protein
MQLRPGGVYVYSAASEFRAIGGAYSPFRFGIVRHLDKRFWLTGFGIRKDLEPLNGSVPCKQRSNVLFGSVMTQVSY